MHRYLIRRLFTLACFATITFNIHGQFDEVNYWHFGAGAALDFSSGNPVVQPSAIGSGEGCASIGDGCGLLFYGDGGTLYDRNHNPMPNGQGLAGECENFIIQSGTQSILIARKPQSDSLFYVFTNDCIEDTLSGGFRFSIVDMSLNNGLGDVTLRDQLLFGPSTEKVAAYMHFDGCSVWILAHEYNSNCFRAYRLSSTGLDTNATISCTGQSHESQSNLGWGEEIARGWMKFSPNGERLVLVATGAGLDYGLTPEIFHFNNSNGNVTSEFLLSDPDSVRYYGACFSPDNSKLYLSGAWYGDYIHQFNLNAGSPTDIFNSRVLLNDSTDQLNLPGSLQNTPDRHIMVSFVGGEILGSIMEPDLLGSLSNYDELSIPLDSGTTSWFGAMPNFIQSYFSLPSLVALFINTPAYSGAPVNFFDNSIDAVSWKWKFGDGTVSYLQNPQHTYSLPGTYTVSLAVTDMTCNYRKICTTIEVMLGNAIQENDQNASWSLMPNPISNSSILQFRKIQIDNSWVEIVDLRGKIVNTINIHQNGQVPISSSDYSSGLYIFRLIEDGYPKLQGKVVIEH